MGTDDSLPDDVITLKAMPRNDRRYIWRRALLEAELRDEIITEAT
jgi:hypothetical protein